MENFKKDGKTSHRKHFTVRRPAQESSPEKIYSTDRSFDDASPAYGERGHRGGERRPYGERRGYGEHRNAPDGERRGNGERRSYGSAEGRGRSSYGGGERRGYGEQRDGERRPYGEKKAWGKPAGRPGPKKGAPRKDNGITNMIRKGKEQLKSSLSNYSDNDYVQPPVQDVVRLNKYIANSGVCSRREADNFILSGCVTVNGEIVTELGSKVNIYTDDVRFNGERLKGEEKVYLVMNKPRGYVTTAGDPHAEKTVLDLIGKCPARVFPVGRLDKNTTGVLLFTNDGEMAQRLTHPSYNKKKIYQVNLDRELKEEDRQTILAGIELSDGLVAADELEYAEPNDHRKLGIEIHSGKNRIVRRIFESLGYEVKALDRVYFAGLTKKGLKKGAWRFLTQGEVNILKMGAYV